MLPSLRQVLELPALRAGAAVVRAGQSRLDELVRWVHVSEISDIAGLLEGGELILTTGIALPDRPAALRRYVDDLVRVGACGVVVELGRRYHGALPAALVSAARVVDLPLVELHRETPFVSVTQEVHTLILNARMRELVASDERQQHRTLLTRLTLSGDTSVQVGDRAAALGVPIAGGPVTAVAVRTAAGDASPALLRDIANRAADATHALDVPALIALLDDQHVVVLLAGHRGDRLDDVLTRLGDELHALRPRPATTLVIGVGATLTGLAGAPVTLREAVRVSDTAAGRPPRAGWFRAADLRLHGLVHDLRDSAPVREYVERELGALLAHEQAERLFEVLAAYCRSGGNKTEAAAAVFVSRASLYDRLRRIEQVLDVDLSDPDVVLGLHFAVVAREALTIPALAVRPGPDSATS